MSFSHEFHSFTSSAVIVCGVAALLFLSLAARRYGWWYARPVGLAAGARRVGVRAEHAGRDVSGTVAGVVQRVQISILCLGLLVIAWALYADRRDAARTARRCGAGRGEPVNEIVNAAREQVHVVESGLADGPPLLLTSGLGGAWFDWAPTVRLLRDEHRVTVFDRPGLGLSPAGVEPPSLRRDTAILEAMAARAAGR